MTSIRTPDQRVRVFVSSTLQELASERLAARRAIGALHLTPVLFEMGARPHPPRDLYRAYLEQSHVFVGIYGSSYGWIAPGMEVSGLEDEYLLSESKPRLVYVKHPAPDRHERLTELLRKVQAADNTCYQRFSTPDELHDLLANDLALLLSERFENAGGEGEARPAAVPPRLRAVPAPRTALFGREALRARAAGLLQQPGLVTLTGAGGTGKSALALQLAHDCEADFADGVGFVPLSSVDDPLLLAPAIEQTLSMRDAGSGSPWELLGSYLADKRCLLVLDNFEQLASEGPRLTELIDRCGRLTLLVTSRTPLRVRGEHVIEVEPLAVTADAGAEPPAVQLFLQRAREAAGPLTLDERTRAAVVEICRKLDGLPLAIELAAARVRLLPPAALLSRMTKVLDLLERGPHDLPERQRTLRATIEWSYRLLDEPCRQLFRTLGVFESVSLDHAEAAHGGGAALSMLERLLDLGLLRRESGEGEPRLSMLQTVREYALEQLAQHAEVSDARDAHAALFLTLAAELGATHTQPDEREACLTRIELELPNLREAFHHLLPRRAEALALLGCLSRFWFMRGYVSEGKRWLAAGNIGFDSTRPPDQDLNDAVRAAAYQASGMIHLMANDYRRAIVDLDESARLHGVLGDVGGRARALVALGLAALNIGDERGAVSLHEAFQLAETTDTATFITAAAFIAEGFAARGELEKADDYIERGAQAGRRAGEASLVGMITLQRGNLAVTKGNVEHAEACYREALVLMPQKVFSAYPGWALIGLAYCCLCSDRIDEARNHLDAALGYGRRISDNTLVLGALLGFSVAALRAGEARTGARLLGGVEGWLERSGFTVWSATRRLFQDARALCAAQPELEPERVAARSSQPEALLALLP